MKINELSNEEVVFIYTFMKDMVKAYEEIIEDKGLLSVVKTEDGTMEIFQPLEEEQLEELKNSPKNVLCSTIATKLKPVAKLIEESNPALYGEIENSLYFESDEEKA